MSVSNEVATEQDGLAPFNGAGPISILQENVNEVVEQVKDMDERLESLQDEVSISQITDCSNWTLLVLNVTMFVTNAVIFWYTLKNGKV